MSQIIDAFEIKESYGLASPPGFVIVLDNDPVVSSAHCGSVVTIELPTGDKLEFTIEVVKQHGQAKSFLLKNATLNQIPAGSTLLSVKQGMLQRA